MPSEKYIRGSAWGDTQRVASQFTRDTETAYAVADGNLIGGLLLVFRLHQLRDGQSGFGEPLLIALGQMPLEENMNRD
jgi:hypothetical protein